MKVISNKGWGCKIKLYKEQEGDITPVQKGETFTVSYKYFKKGTIATLVKQIEDLPKIVNQTLTPKINSCETRPKEKLKKNTPRPTIIEATDIAEKILSSYESLDGVEKMLTKLRSNCSKYCCYNNCLSKLPYRSWCKGRFQRKWDLGEKKKQCSDSLGRCYGYAKLGLMSGGFFDEYLKKHKVNYPWTYSPHAKDAGRLLKKSGFINVLTDKRFKNKKITPYNCPKGAVLVYGARPDQSGHIEVVDVEKDGSRKYYSDFVGNKPIYENQQFPSLTKKTRPLIGIYIKEVENE
jgi:hypothetical protein